MADWSDPSNQVSTYFKVKEALFLPSWGRMAQDSDGLNDDIRANLEALCAKLDVIRAFLACPISVTSMYRPGPYSVLVGGSSTDVHTHGLAVDFHCDADMTIEDIKNLLLPKLEEFGIRMEQGTTTWVHIDIAPVKNARYFLP